MFQKNLSKKKIKIEIFRKRTKKTGKKPYIIFTQMSTILDVNKNFKIYIPKK